MKRAFVSALVALAFLSAPVIADELPVYLWINFVKAKPGQGEAVTNMMIKEDSKVFDSLVASGAAGDWGVAMPVVHDGHDTYSHVEWVSFIGWAGADAFMKTFQEQRSKVGKADLDAMNAEWDAAVEPGSHADLITRNVYVGKGTGERPTYIHLGYHKANPAKFSELGKLFKEVGTPVFDKLIAEGKIIDYGLEAVDIHRGQDWDYMTWYSSKDLAARDAVDAAFDAAWAARSEEESEALRQRFMDDRDWSGHSDQILLVVHYKSQTAK
jgi:hypothetical protein